MKPVKISKMYETKNVAVNSKVEESVEEKQISTCLLWLMYFQMLYGISTKTYLEKLKQ